MIMTLSDRNRNTLKLFFLAPYLLELLELCSEHLAQEAEPMTKQPTVYYYLEARKKLLDSLGGCCLYCQSPIQLEFHHVKGNGDSHGIGGWQQLYKIQSELRAGEDIVLLCRQCHQDLHSGMISPPRKDD